MANQILLHAFLPLHPVTCRLWRSHGLRELNDVAKDVMI